jgi:hypothetical protein
MLDSTNENLDAPELEASAALSFANPAAKPASPKPQGDIFTGAITGYGYAPYLHKDNSSPSFYIDIHKNGKTRTIWGSELEHTLRDQGLKLNDRIVVYEKGQRPVRRTHKLIDSNGRITREETKTEMKTDWQVAKDDGSHEASPIEEIIEVMHDDKSLSQLCQTRTPEPGTHGPLNYFPSAEFALIADIWKDVPRESSSHDPTGYHLHLSRTRSIAITRDNISIDKSLWRSPPDQVYVAACGQARQLWDGRMEVNGDIAHRIKALAYATVYGVEITNFTPTSREQVEVHQLVEKIRNSMEPSFGRPQDARKPQSPKPSPR